MKAELPNVLLITADQLRYDCVGYSGKYPVRTPNLDLLASQSVAFSHAYSNIPVCGPARQSLLNGRRSEMFGALWNYNGALPVASLQPDAYAWTKTLANSGYMSAFLGKWGVNPVFDPTAFGYQTYVSESDYRNYRKNLYPEVSYTNGFFGEVNPIPVEDAQTHWFAKQAIETLERLQSGGGPWHLALHFPEPHLPCRPSGRFAMMYDPAAIPQWDGFSETFAGKPYIQQQQLYSWGIEQFTWEDWAPIAARYYGIISQMDEAIGRVLTALDKLDAAKNTIVIFTADHGDMCGSHRMMDKHYILYDDVVRVPLIIRLPDRRQEGIVCSRFVYNFLDFAPTLLELLGLEADDPGNLQGTSLVPLLSEHQGTIPWRDFIVSTYNGQQFGLYTQRMIRTEQWKYVWNPTDTDELYDLLADPAELANRITESDGSGILTELRRKLYEQLTKDGDALAGNEWTRRQLLGGSKLVRRT
ncbi:sulfatase-like hydrolase/transferase [Paenibacillus abyssi]|uniref:Sulfatase n=1 Tax=Paenibacillus abyssi TaxID=1340531 RepID=A0A917FT30_9BACL|nr:sulfatase-like hydrolase/transferase [Paenibacillus abyssi]GGF99205.1 sulfatase [Paenibacillus abyssi]